MTSGIQVVAPGQRNLRVRPRADPVEQLQRSMGSPSDSIRPDFERALPDDLLDEIVRVPVEEAIGKTDRRRRTLRVE